MARAWAIVAVLGCAPTPMVAPAARPEPEPEPAPIELAETRPPPPPLSGGGLLVDAERRFAVVAESDRDRLWIVDLPELRVRAEVPLEAGDEPGRLAQEGDRIHVALRGGGAVLTFDDEGEIVARRAVCPAPRGMAVHRGQLHVACAGGSLVSLRGIDPAPTRELTLKPDLRDVVVAKWFETDVLKVTRFRSAEVLTIDEWGEITGRQRPRDWDLDALVEATVEDRPRRIFESGVAWRTIATDDGLWMVHQRAATFPIDMEVEDEPPPVGGYGGPGGLRVACAPGIAHATLTHFGSSRATPPPILVGGVLPVDLAVSPHGYQVAVAFAGTGEVGVMMPPRLERDDDHCITRERSEMMRPGAVTTFDVGQPRSVAWVGQNRLLVHYGDPSALVIYERPLLSRGRMLPLGARREAHLGTRIFHEGTRFGLACATCHPEGGDDGRVWQLGAFGGSRRTQPLGGGVLGGPLHWAGDLPDLRALVNEVFVGRMGGAALDATEVHALSEAIQAIPAPPRSRVTDAHAVRRGKRAFMRAGCGACHYGDRFTDERSHDVGTGEVLQTPTLLGLATRAPYFHDGRSPTLAHRLTEGHTVDHGDLGRLDEGDIGDLEAYLASL